jgi:hypothetical protein
MIPLFHKVESQSNLPWSGGICLLLFCHRILPRLRLFLPGQNKKDFVLRLDKVPAERRSHPLCLGFASATRCLDKVPAVCILLCK